MFLHHLNVIGVLHLWVSQSNLSVGEQRKKSLKKKKKKEEKCFPKRNHKVLRVNSLGNQKKFRKDLAQHLRAFLRLSQV